MSRLAGRPPGPVADLRRLFQVSERGLVERGAPPSIGSHLDEIVNAIDTAMYLVGLVVLDSDT